MLRTSREQHQAAGQYGAMNAAPSVAPFAQSARLRCGRHESTKTSAGDSQSLISQIKTPQSRGQQRSRQIRSAAFFDMPQTRLRNLTVVVSRRTLRVLIDVTGGSERFPWLLSADSSQSHQSHPSLLLKEVRHENSPRGEHRLPDCDSGVGSLYRPNVCRGTLWLGLGRWVRGARIRRLRRLRIRWLWCRRLRRVRSRWLRLGGLGRQHLLDCG
jgi:hypothetical protein